MKNKYDLNQRKRPLSPLRFFLIWIVFIVCSLPLTTALQAQVTELVTPAFSGSLGIGKWYGKVGRKYAAINGINLPSSYLVLNGTEDIFSNTSVTCGKFDSVSPQNTKGRFKIMDPEADSAIGTHDVNVVCDSLPFIPPGSGLNRSVRIGNVCGDGEAEGLFMDFLVTPSSSLLTLYYSMVFEYIDDENHADAQSPEFIMELRDKNTGQLLDSCMHLRISNYKANNSDIWKICQGINGSYCENTDGCIAYTPWRRVELNLTPFIGDTVTLSIKTGDCAYTAHYGYAYFAGSTGEFSPFEIQNCGIEETDTVAMVSAPNGLGYNWYFGEISKPHEWIKVPKDRDGKRVLSLLKSDFDQYTTNGYELTVVCNMGSKMNQEYSCTSSSGITVRNNSPKIIISETILGELSRRFKNLSMSADLNILDTSLTYWEIIEEGYETVIYKNSHNFIDHRFNTGGYKYVRLYVTPKDGICSSKKTFRIITHPVESVSLGLRELRATIGAEDTILHATVEPVKAFNKKVSWRSTDTTVVKVDQAGKLQFIGEGTAFIIVTTHESYFSDSLKVSVVIPVEGVSLGLRELRATIYTEDTILHATVAPAKASNKMVNWQSTDTAVVKVNQTGTLQFIGEGTAFIIVTTLEGHFSDSLRIVVDDVSIAKVEAERISVKKQGKEVTITSIDQNQIEQLKVYDVAGRLLLQAHPKSTTYTFKVKKKAIIIIEIQLQDGIHIVKKIIG